MLLNKCEQLFGGEEIFSIDKNSPSTSKIIWKGVLQELFKYIYKNTRAKTLISKTCKIKGKYFSSFLNKLTWQCIVGSKDENIYYKTSTFKPHNSEKCLKYKTYVVFLVLLLQNCFNLKYYLQQNDINFLKEVSTWFLHSLVLRCGGCASCSVCVSVSFSLGCKAANQKNFISHT